ncbi:MAG: response regulator transcription factor [Candidatus Eremiobacteraeota bacterium]|nr:response regulator transcription factor [Candidatus Eremiobacteraeota bacterium]MDQ6943369.1 response regulator transcription factor [Candidatus Eremiobacteraeota bacterium]
MRALVVEDDPAVRDVIARALTSDGYDVVAAATGIEGDARAADGTFDVAIVDWNLPGLSGVELVRRLREAGATTPVLFVTARDAVGDRVDGLDAGADDYLVKPFHIDELLARVRSVIRRAGTRSAAQLSAGGVALDARTRGVSVDGTPVTLSAREYDLLDHLVRNAGLALARADIEERVWGNSFEPSSNVLEVMIGRVRRKLGARAGQVETVRGHGYRFKRETATGP